MVVGVGRIEGGFGSGFGREGFGGDGWLAGRWKVFGRRGRRVGGETSFVTITFHSKRISLQTSFITISSKYHVAAEFRSGLSR